MKYRILPIVVLANVCFAKLETNNNCGLSQQAQNLAEIILKSEQQKRKKLVCNVQLARAAQEKAQALATANEIAHNINHITPNEFLLKHGITLPFSYKVLGNQVEAINGGKQNARESFDYFMSSPDHKAHILGENSFYESQDKIGVGYFHDDNKNHEDYWVVYITAFRKDGDVIVKTNKIKIQFVNKSDEKKRFKRGDTIEKREFKF